MVCTTAAIPLGRRWDTLFNGETFLALPRAAKHDPRRAADGPSLRPNRSHAIPLLPAQRFPGLDVAARISVHAGYLTDIDRGPISYEGGQGHAGVSRQTRSSYRRSLCRATSAG